MRNWVPVAASALGAAALATASGAVLAKRRWELETQHLVGELGATTAPAWKEGRRVSLTAIETLPPPVQRYFRTVLQDGQPYVRAATIEQSGRFNLTTAGDDWRPFEATQYYFAGPPGYVWDARIRMAPLLDAHVRDAYAAHHGSMRGALLAAVDIVNERHRAELDEAALQRYLAEAAWFPTALLPEQGVVWTPLDDNRATACITDGTTIARLQFEFAPSGDVAGVFTPHRYRAEKGRYLATPWGGRFSRYELRDGMRVPTEGDAYWLVGGRHCSYVALRATAASFEFAP